jgi:hypothetical protein
MALMAIKDEYSVRSSCARLCMSFEVLCFVEAKLVGSPSIVTKTKYPVKLEVLIPAGLVELSFQDHKGWKAPARCANTLNCCHSRSIAWLNKSCSTYCVSASDNI